MKKIVLIAMLIPFAAIAGESEYKAEYKLVVKDQQFQPVEITMLPGIKIKLEIENQDDTPFEFESADISREAIVSGHSKTSIYIGPLEPGSYRFLNDFNHHIEGTIVVKSTPAKGK
jgi:hypothetical protein